MRWRLLSLYLVAFIVVSTPSTAYAALNGIAARETNSWAGVAGSNYVYPWVLVPGGTHVSSIYLIKSTVADPSGYLNHFETGLARSAGDPTAEIFYAFNVDHDNLPDQIGWAVAPANNNTWISHEINRFSTSGGYHYYRLAWNGNVVAELRSTWPLATARSTSEYKNTGDDNRASFHALSRKTDSGTWGLWSTLIWGPQTSGPWTGYARSASSWYCQ